eukprot:5039904-Pyramimonas_sp.AAC.1
MLSFTARLNSASVERSRPSGSGFRSRLSDPRGVGDQRPRRRGANQARLAGADVVDVRAASPEQTLRGLGRC